MQRRVLVLDGAVGTMIRREAFDEAAFRGARFRDHPHALKGANDLLCLTRPATIEAVHRAYLEAGADVISTNTFSSTRIGLARYGLEPLVPELNEAAARLARGVADAFETPDRPRWVVGAVGPTDRTASTGPDVERSRFRAVGFDELARDYAEQIEALVRGGVDAILIETVFDALNALAALRAASEVGDARGIRVPVMLSRTTTDASGRTLSPRALEAFWTSVSPVPLVSIGLNCALGAETLRPYVRELSRLAPIPTTVHPSAGLPNALGGYDEGPEAMTEVLDGFLEEGLVNLIGGCCGTTPDHVRRFAEAAARRPPRIPPRRPGRPASRASGR